MWLKQNVEEERDRDIFPKHQQNLHKPLIFINISIIFANKFAVPKLDNAVETWESRHNKVLFPSLYVLFLSLTLSKTSSFRTPQFPKLYSNIVGGFIFKSFIYVSDNSIFIGGIWIMRIPVSEYLKQLETIKIFRVEIVKNNGPTIK